MAWTSLLCLLVSVFLSTNATRFAGSTGPYSVPSWAVVLATLFLYILTFSIFKYKIYPYYLSPYRALPLAKDAVFPFGHAAALLKRPTGLVLAGWQKEIDAETVKQQAFFRIMFGPNERLVAASPEASAQIFHAKAYDMRQTAVVTALLESSIGKTVLTAAGEEHKEMRKSLVPALSPEFVRQLVPPSWSSALRIRDQIEREEFGPSAKLSSDGWATFDVFHWMLSGFLRGFASVALSIDIDRDDVGRELLPNYGIMYPTKGVPVTLVSIFDRLRPVLFPQWLDESLPKSARTKNMNRARDNLSKIYLDLVHERFNNEKPAEKADILDRMCSREFNIEPTNAVRQLHALVAAGHETTSCVMAWALYELAQRPKLAQRLRQEIKTVIGDPGTANVDANKIDSLELLHCFVMEVLRFYPPVSFLPRTVVNDVVICDHYLPRGTVVYMSLIGHNRSKTVFGGDAEEFRPERWMADGGGSSQTASAKNIHTFGHGARGCLGRDYATRVLKCFTAVLVSRFEMEPVPGHVVEFRANSSTLRPKGELPLRIRVVGE